MKSVDINSQLICALIFIFVSGSAYAQDTPTPPANLARVTAATVGGENIPTPDPTKLTTEAVDRLKENILELFGAKLDAINKELDRLAKVDHERSGEIHIQVASLETLINEKFKSVDQQFLSRDVALSAALLAQKTSVDEQNKSNALSAAKSEAGFAKQIDGLSLIIAAQSKGTDDKINDLKDRITAIESRGAGANDVWGWVVGGLGLGVAVLMASLSLLRRETQMKGR